MGLLERERTWHRERLFPAWDRTGGPVPVSRWLLEHPVATTVGGLLVAAALLGSGLLREPGAGVPWGALVLLGVLGWLQRLRTDLYREWLVTRGAADRAPRPGVRGWWERPPELQPPRAAFEGDPGTAPITTPHSHLVGLNLRYLLIGLAAASLTEALT